MDTGYTSQHRNEVLGSPGDFRGRKTEKQHAGRAEPIEAKVYLHKGLTSGGRGDAK